MSLKGCRLDTARWWLLLPRDTILLMIMNIGALLTLKSVLKGMGGRSTLYCQYKLVLVSAAAYDYYCCLCKLVLPGDVNTASSFSAARVLAVTTVGLKPREMITSQLQGKLWLYDEVHTRLCTKKQQTYKLIIGSIDVNAARYVLVLPMAVNTASLIFKGRLVLPVHVNAAITKVTTVGLKPVLCWVTTDWFKRKLTDCFSEVSQILGVAWYKGNILKGKFCFIQGDDYISTSGEALAL
ncbi:hypothetical protein Tco_0500626 [Tanacetum coccineum]